MNHPKSNPARPTKSQPTLTLRSNNSWAYLRATRFISRPGHADQLHLDLWWRGLNLAQDAGTYLYNAPPPWDNSFTRTSVHNTLTANGQEQMSRLSRFLYVGWAQAEILAWDPTRNRIVAQHDGYRRLGLVHRRSVEYRQGYWMVSDRLLPIQARRRPGGAPVTARLHWLLPDWPWEIKPEKDQIVLSVESPEGPVHLTISGRDSLRAGLVRAGEWIYGEGPMEPSWGWTSPTYGYKIPALSFSVWLSSLPPLEITSEWALQG